MQGEVGIAVVGLGRISATHIDGIEKNPNKCRLAAVVDANGDLARSAAEKYSVPGYTSLTEALSDDEVQAVIICLPHHLHEATVIEAVQAGRHVLVEKVMARTVAEARRMTDEADKNGVKLMVAQSRRYITHLREAREMLPQIGRLQSVLYTFLANFDASTAPVWWRSKDATGGLIYPMMGSHSIDFCLWLNEAASAVSVFAKGTDMNPYFEGDDGATIVISFDDGSVATNFLSVNSRVPRHEGIITGTEGTIHFNHEGDHGGGLVGVPQTNLFLNGQLVRSGASEPHAFAVQVDEFVSSILEGREPESSGKRILRQIEIIEAAQLSAAEGRLVPLT